MAVKRQVCDDAVYHIIQKGNNSLCLFEEDRDFSKFLSLIKKYKTEYSFELYNYCLMNNHVHFLMKVFRKNDLAKLMQGILQSYRFYFKRKHPYSGYLYSGRYKSKIIKNDEYFLECARYIETNPLRAKVVKELKNYKWSSYTFYAYGERDSLLTSHPLFETFGNKCIGREAYQRYILMPRMYED